MKLNPIRTALSCAVVAALTSAAGAQISYEYIEAGTGTVLGNMTFSSDVASYGQSWTLDLGIRDPGLQSLSIDFSKYSAVGGRVFTLADASNWYDPASPIQSNGQELIGGGLIMDGSFGSTSQLQFFFGTSDSARMVAATQYRLSGSWVAVPSPAGGMAMGLGLMMVTRRRR